MALKAAVGQAYGIEARETGLRAVEAALLRAGSQLPAAAFVFIDTEFIAQDVLRAIIGMLKNVPVFGFTTEGQIHPAGAVRRSVVVALLVGDDVNVRAGWWPAATGAGERPRDGQTTDPGVPALADARATDPVERMRQDFDLSADLSTGLLLLGADSQSEDCNRMAAKLPVGRYTLAGGLVGGLQRETRPFLAGGGLGGETGLTAALLTGNIRVGAGLGLGWQPVGAYFQVTQAEGYTVRTLDGQPAAERYASLFGHEAKAWTYPPLNQLVRLYPLGFEPVGEQTRPLNRLQVAAPLRVEADGSLRMNRPVPSGAVAHLLLGSPTDCRQAVQSACEAALKGLGIGRPVLALVFADLAWRMLFDTQAEDLVGLLRKALGPELPLAGGYLLGQLANPTGRPELFNQHLQVVVIGEKSLS